MRLKREQEQKQNDPTVPVMKITLSSNPSQKGIQQSKHARILSEDQSPVETTKNQRGVRGKISPQKKIVVRRGTTKLFSQTSKN